MFARFHLTGPLVTWDLTERGPVLAQMYNLIVKSWYISALLSSGLKDWTGQTGLEWPRFTGNYLLGLSMYSIYMTHKYKRHIVNKTGTVYCSMPCVYIVLFTYLTM